MAENHFTQMVGTLRGGSWPAIPLPKFTAATKTEPSKCAQLRHLIMTQGPISPLSLALELDLEGGSALVRALLKGDFNAGRIIARDGKYLWNPDYDAQLERDLHAAQRLLLAHGYQVKKPGRQPAATDTP